MTPEQKELVVLAAKAMGYEGEWYSEQCEDYVCDGILPKDFEGIPALNVWNPLTSEADCFRMETELGITVGYGLTGFVESYKLDERGYVDMQFYEEIGTDKAAARRLASTRVAAEIGKRNG